MVIIDSNIKSISMVGPFSLNYYIQISFIKGEISCIFFIFLEFMKLDNKVIWVTVFDLIGALGAYVNLFSTTSAKRSSSGR